MKRTLFPRMPARALRRYTLNIGIEIRWYHYIPWYGRRRLRRDCGIRVFRVRGDVAAGDAVVFNADGSVSRARG